MMEMPFTTEQFFNVFEKYNLAVFPVQIIIGLSGLLALLLTHSGLKYRNILIGSYMGLLWIWIGLMYHLRFFTDINRAAFVFGTLFMLQGIMILLTTINKKLIFEFVHSSQTYTGYFFILYGLLIYPMISYLVSGAWTKVIAAGLPCPSTILTFGFLLLTTGRFPKLLLIIPSLWAVVGMSAAVNFGVYQDLMIIIAALLSGYYILRKSKAGHRGSGSGILSD